MAQTQQSAGATGADLPMVELRRAWTSGRFQLAARLSHEICDRQPTDEAQSIRALSAYAIGDYATTVAAWDTIQDRHSRFADIRDTVLWAHVRQGEIDRATKFADSEGLLKDPATREQLRLAGTRPLQVSISETVILPFTDDNLSAYMPGIAVRVNGQATVARLDTGGSFVHLTRTQARRMDIQHAGSAREFAGLISAPVSYGTVNLELSGIRMTNVPAMVHADRTFASAPIARAFGVDIGPIIGTNVLAQFLATVDSPGQRLILSDKDDAAAVQQHRSLFKTAAYGSPAATLPFGLVDSHMLVLRAKYGGHDVPMFFDSGLVAVDESHGQAHLLLPRSAANQWAIPTAPNGQITVLPDPLSLDTMRRTDASAMVVTNRTWANFGNWSGVDVRGLISYGFVRHSAWTIDFTHRTLTLHERATTPPPERE